MASDWHLAQVNVAWAAAPLDDPRMADFRARIEEVNRLAEAAPGFVWRAVDDEPPPERADSRLLYNLSVWESPAALRAYVYSGRHLDVFRERARWFSAPSRPHLALWWIPAGERPDSREAFERLDHLDLHGATSHAFLLKQVFPPPSQRRSP